MFRESRGERVRAGRRSAYSFAVALALVLGFAVLIGQPSVVAEVRNSKHDFSLSGNGGIWGSAEVDEVCIFCHTPHRANTTDIGPLWNREEITASFSLYGSETLDGSPAQPTGSSLACLGCHDGAIAIDMFRAGHPSTPNMMSLGDVYYPGSPYGEGGANIGESYAANPSVNDLGNDHPVSFVYDEALALADGGLRDPGTLPADLPLFEGRLECATCHDVHDGTPAIPSLLRVNISGSELCLSCHNK